MCERSTKSKELTSNHIQKLVKQDLVISAYKPNGGLEDRFKLEAGTEDGVWDFVRTHLKQLPVFVNKDRQLEVIAGAKELSALRPNGGISCSARRDRSDYSPRISMLGSNNAFLIVKECISCRIKLLNTTKSA